jgi:ubiquinone/menaquinone biosynthesis C-methylase UbiE
MFEPGGPTLWELLVQAMSSTERGYDLIAEKFDRTPFRTPDPILEAMAEVIGPIASALDVCCGTGAAMRHLRPLCTERVVGLDMSQGMLDEARRRLANAPGSARVELVRGDALSMTFDSELDVVVSVGAFGHILEKDEPELLRRIYAALKPGGRFVFATGPRPRPTSAWFWMAHGFNAVMRARNALRKPEFVMYYLTFLWPEVWRKLERAGFRVEGKTGRVGRPFERAVIVVATKPGS